MSGGSHDYLYSRVEELFVGKMYDIELNDLMKDVANIMHDLEWYDSGDYDPDGYFDTVKAFKKKWFEFPRKDRLKKYIDKSVEDLRVSLYQMLGENIERK